MALPTASLKMLQARAALTQGLREFFIAQGYWEVETPLISQDVCVDQWLDPVAVPVGSGQVRYLQTSPEFAMKRLLVAGAEAIFQFTKAIRSLERGPRHNPEFTMLEWYRVGDTDQDQMNFTERLVRAAVRLAQANGAGCQVQLPEQPFERVAYDTAFERAIGTRVLQQNADELRSLADSLGVRVQAPETLDRDAWLNLILAERVEPWIAQQGAVFLHDFPASQAALARVRHESPPVAERFELYIGGVELCNGYHEITDASELRRRMENQAALRARERLSALPVESHLETAMRHGYPASAGVALGYDRLLMWLWGCEAIDQVIAFPWEIA
jgi:lysyl-tRNA synthetase class 2